MIRPGSVFRPANQREANFLRVCRISKDFAFEGMGNQGRMEKISGSVFSHVFPPFFVSSTP